MVEGLFVALHAPLEDRIDGILVALRIVEGDVSGNMIPDLCRTFLRR